MNRNLLSALGLTLVLAVSGVLGCSQGSTAAGEAPLYLPADNNATTQGDIQVTGLGEITLVPDLATLRLGVSCKKDSVVMAQAAASRAMNNVIAALKKHGVAEKDIQTQYYNIWQTPRWDWDIMVGYGYEVSNIVSAKIRDMDEVGAIIDAAAEAGGNLTRIEGVSFSVEDPSSYYKELREKAMADARAKAEQIADFFEITLGKPTHISEQGIPIPPIWDVYYYAERAVDGGGVPTPISAGETTLSLSIYVTYATSW
jgi:hypothetical protein